MQQNKSRPPEFKKLFELLKRYKFILLVLTVGILLISLPVGRSKTQTVGNPNEYNYSFEINELEARMEKILSRIEGTGNLSLLLTVKGESENIYAANTEYREDGEEREESLEVVTISTGSGVQKPVIISRNFPPFQGALVVCDGGDDPAVKLLITKAVAALTGLGTDRITVCR